MLVEQLTDSFQVQTQRLHCFLGGVQLAFATSQLLDPSNHLSHCLRVSLICCKREEGAVSASEHSLR